MGFSCSGCRELLCRGSVGDLRRFAGNVWLHSKSEVPSELAAVRAGRDARSADRFWIKARLSLPHGSQAHCHLLVPHQRLSGFLLRPQQIGWTVGHAEGIAGADEAGRVSGRSGGLLPGNNTTRNRLHGPSPTLGPGSLCCCSACDALQYQSGRAGDWHMYMSML